MKNILVILSFLFPVVLYSQKYEAETYVTQFGTGVYCPSNDVGGTCVIGGVESGDWVEYNTSLNGRYIVQFRLSTMYGTGLISVNGKNINIPFTNNAWITLTDTIDLSGGKMRVNFLSYRVNFNWYQIGALVSSMPPPPTAYAGRDTTILFPQRSYRISAIATGDSVSYAWALVSTSISGATTQAITFALYDSVRYTYGLTVTDRYGRLARDTVVITALWRPYDTLTELRMRSDIDTTQKSSISVLNDGTIAIGIKW